MQERSHFGHAVPRTSVPEVVVLRLPLYLRILTSMSRQGIEIVSSQALGLSLGMTPAQIRKDLSYFGRFGKQGKGYTVQHLLSELRKIMGLDQEWNVALVGVGRLGRAIIGYPGFAPEGFKIVAAFDDNPSQMGQIIGGLRVQPITELPRVIKERDIHIAIAAVPSTHTQTVINLLTDSGIQAILNCAPYTPEVPTGVRVSNIDPVLSLQAMTFYLA